MEWYPCSYSGEGTENRTVTFTQAEKRENIKSGEKHKTIFGKIARWFADLKTVAFTGSYNDLTGRPSSFPPSSHKHSKSDITDFPSSLPASDVKAWAKAANKPAYNWSEIGGRPSLLGAARANGYCGMVTDNHEDNQWIRTTSQGILPYQSGGLTTAHSSVGTDTWYFNSGYMRNVHAQTVYTDYIELNNSYNLKFDLNKHPDVTNSMVFEMYCNGSYKRSLQIFSYPSSGILFMHPNVDGAIQLGSPDKKFSQLYAKTSTIATSDRNQKKEISYTGQKSNYDTYMTDETLTGFIMGLLPCIYRLIENESNRPHHGFISQDIEELLKKLGIDHAGFIKSPKTETIEVEKEVEEEYTDETDGQTKTRTIIIKDRVLREIPGEYIYSLRYEEFIADIVRFCQILYNRDTELENALKEQKEKTEGLEKRAEALENIIKQMV